MSRPVVVEPEAERELWAAREWYESQRPGLGLQLLDAANDAVRRIAQLPDACTPVPGVPTDLGARRAFLDGFPYAAVFIELGDRVSILAFAHFRRRPG